MLKFLQERVNKSTKEFDALADAERAKAGAEGTQALSQRQGRVRDLTRKLAAKLDKDNQSEGGR
ncbi:MAG: hypothetical protein H6838_02740 [Planctomycetes bacterium]|nr:hypothetical protein [Planctomycetota bacterium]MCB9884377.1 hypothetical protein [Planctomycetota bacterium]